LNAVQWDRDQEDTAGIDGGDEVLKDIRILGVRNWTRVVMDSSAWPHLVEKSKTHRQL